MASFVLRGAALLSSRAVRTVGRASASRVTSLQHLPLQATRRASSLTAVQYSEERERFNGRLGAMGAIGAAVGCALGAFMSLRSANAEEEEKVDWTNAVKGNYDNRIRFYSSPDKIFTTFATQQAESGEALMTLDDFIHAVLPSDFRGKRETMSENVPEFFRLADLDGDGLISYVSRDVKDADMVFNRFFGGSARDRISFEEFEQWLTGLHTAVRELEFARFDENNVGSIPMSYFGISLVGYAAPRDVPGYLKRCESLMGREGRITKEEFLAFAYVLEHISDIISVCQMFSSSGYEMCQKDFNRAVKAVTGESLSHSVLETIFVVFDRDGDGHLDYDELMGVLSHRQGMNLEHSRDTGFFRLMSCCKDCFSS